MNTEQPQIEQTQNKSPVKAKSNNLKNETPAENRVVGSKPKSLAEPVEAATVQSEWISMISQRVADLDKSVQGFIKAQPVVSALVAIGAGFATSLLLSKITAPKKEAV